MLFGEDYETTEPEERLPVTELSRQEQKIVNYIEQYWFTRKGLPMPEKVATDLGISRTLVAGALSSLPVIYALEDRGITYAKQGLLTERQLAAANTIYNFNDRRSDANKLSALGISVATYDGWKRLPAFQDYLRQRAENLYEDSPDEAARALLAAVRKGDIRAITYYNELTGRFSSKTVGELNVNFFMVKIIEVLQRELSDQPEVLSRVAMGLQALVPSQGTGTVDSTRELGSS